MEEENKNKEVESTDNAPILRLEARLTAVWAVLHMVFYFGVAVGTWGLVFKKLLLFIIIGIGVGFLISLVFIAPVVASQRVKGKIKDMMFGAGAIWGGLAMIIGIAGIIAFIIRLIFFK
jgi:uncharacterized membrane protein